MSQPKNYGLNELREMFLHFFETKGHLRLPSFSLIPQNDASLLLINSGMAPMKPYFTGEQEPPRHRVTTCQKCIRTGDIENIVLQPSFQSQNVSANPSQELPDFL